MKKTRIFIAAAFAAAMLSSCGKMLDAIAPKDQISSSSLNESDIVLLTNGTLHQYEAFLKNLWFEGDYYGENFKGGPGFTYTDVHGDLQSPSAAIPCTRWQYCFDKLKYANLLIKTAADCTDQSSADVREALGTGYLFRAMIYNALVQRYGGVPFIVDAGNTSVVPRSSEQQIWEKILEDIARAEEYLSEFRSIAYPSLEACYVLHSKVCLWNGDFAGAKNYADKVLSSNRFSLSADSISWASMYINGTSSSEIIFAPINIRLTDNIRIFESCNDSDGSFNYSPADDVYASLFSDNEFKEGDIRKDPTFSAEDPTLVRKFPNGQGGQFINNPDASQSPLMCWRLADVYLAKAEAQLGLDELAEAETTLKTFLQARYSSVTLPDNMTAAQIEELLLDENRREFYAEGHRWFDVKRFGLLRHGGDFSTWIDTQYKDWNGRDFLLYWPVPQTERDKSGGLYTQNPGYAGYNE